MNYFLLIIMILTNAGETISYKNTKVKNGLDILFGVSFWSLFLSILSLPLSLCIGSGQLFENFNWINFGLISFGTVLALLSITFWAKASNDMPMSIAEGVSEIYIAFLTFFSWLLFGGVLTIWHIVLIAVVVLSCLFLAFIQNKQNGKQKNYNYKRGFIFLAFWVIVYIIRGLIPGALADAGMNGIAYNFILNLLMFIVVLIIVLVKKRGSFVGLKETLKDPWLFIIGLCRTASQISLLQLAFTMNLGVVDAVSVFGIVLIMLYERFIMKEKISWQSYILLIFIAVATAALVVL